MPASRRHRLLVAWAVLNFGLLVRTFASGLVGHGQAADPPWQEARVDVNRASVAELMTLPGIGPERAEAIVLSRVRSGPFARLDDLTRVDGIGRDTLLRLQPFALAGPPRAR